MQCSKCGYVMGEMETECLRCKRLGNRAAHVAPTRPVAKGRKAAPELETEKECPVCGKASRLDAVVCDQCGYDYDPGISPEERYQALLAAQAQTGRTPSPLRRPLPPVLCWSIIAVCLLVMLGAGWVIFGSSVSGQGETTDLGPIVMLRHLKRHHGAALRSVTYKVQGTAAQALVTYHGADGAPISSETPVPLPWTQTLKAKPGAPLSLSAKPSGGSGTVTAEIDVNGALRKQESAPDEDGTVTVSGTL